MNNIPMHRALLYLLILGLLPLIFVVVNYTAQKELQASLYENLTQACERTAFINVREKACKQVRDFYQDKDHFYLDKHVSTIPLLSHEATSIQKILNSGFHPEEEQLKRRHSFLTGGENTLGFSQNQEKTYAGLKESIFHSNKPVEVCVQDLHKILARIEGVQIGQEKPHPSRPHLIITDFRIEKKKALLGDVYALNLKLIKREYQK